MRLTVDADDPRRPEKRGAVVKDSCPGINLGEAQHEKTVVLAREHRKAIGRRPGDRLDEGSNFRPVIPAVASRRHLGGYEKARAALRCFRTECEQTFDVAFLGGEDRLELDRGDAVACQHNAFLQQT